MKKNLLTLAMLLMVAVTTASAQAYRNSRYYNPGSDRLDYRHGPVDYRHSYHRSCFTPSYWGCNSYLGFRVGPSFSSLGGDNNDSGTLTGLDAGIAVGISVSGYLPLYLESGLYYMEKGAGDIHDNCSNTYYNNTDCRLRYLEIPIVLKYTYSPNGHFSLQPFAGGYMAYGASSSIKGSNLKMFGNNGELQRFDDGLRIGCGISYDVLYAEMAYDYGLTNINKDNHWDTHTSSLQLTVGVNF